MYERLYKSIMAYIKRPDHAKIEIPNYLNDWYLNTEGTYMNGEIVPVGNAKNILLVFAKPEQKGRLMHPHKIYAEIIPYDNEDGYVSVLLCPDIMNNEDCEPMDFMLVVYNIFLACNPYPSMPFYGSVDRMDNVLPLALTVKLLSEVFAQQVSINIAEFARELSSALEMSVPVSYVQDIVSTSIKDLIYHGKALSISAAVPYNDAPEIHQSLPSVVIE